MTGVPTEEQLQGTLQNNTHWPANGFRFVNVDSLGNIIDVQHPFPTDGDSVYIKDIKSTSDEGTFTGTITNLFTTENTGLVDSSATNPKSFTVVLNRPITASGIGLTTGTGNFSNVKIYLYDEAGILLSTIDDSGTSTNRTGYCYYFAPMTFCQFKVEFHTADTVNVDFCYIEKSHQVHARFQAISETTGALEDITSDDGQLNMLVRLRDATGNTKINPARSNFQNPSGSGTNELRTLTNANTSYAIPSSAPTTGYRINVYNNSDSIIYIGYQNTNANGVAIYPTESIEDNLGSGQQLYAYCASAGKTLVVTYKESE